MLPSYDLLPLQRLQWRRIQGGDFRLLDSLIRVPDGVELPAIVTAVRRLLAAHDGLRSRFVVTDAPRQQILPLDDAVSAGISEQFDVDVPADVRELLVPPVDIYSSGSRFVVLHTHDGRTLLHVVVAHILTDHFGFQVAVRDLRALLAGRPLEPIARMQRRDLAAAARPAEIAANTQHWRSALSGARSSRFYQELADPAAPLHWASFRLSPPRTARLQGTAKRLRTLPSVVVMAALSVVGGACAGEPEQLFAHLVNARRSAEAFASLDIQTYRVVSRLAVDPGETLADRIRRMHSAVMDGFRHVPFDPIVLASAQMIEDGRDPARELFRVNYIEDVGGIDWDVVDMSNVAHAPRSSRHRTVPTNRCSTPPACQPASTSTST